MTFALAPDQMDAALREPFNALVTLVIGGPSEPALMTGIDSDTSVGVIARNLGSGGAFQAQSINGATLLLANESGVTIPTLIVTSLSATTINAATVNTTTLSAAGNSALGNDAGDTTTITGNATVSGTLVGSSTVQGTRLISTIATGTAPLTVASTTQVTNLNASFLGGFTKAQLDSAYVDVTGDTMTGALTMEPSAATDQIIKVKGSSGSGGFWIGATNVAAPTLMFRDNANGLMALMGATGSTYALDVNSSSLATNAARFTKDVLITTDLGVRTVNATTDLNATANVTGAKVAAGGTTFTGSEKLHVIGSALVDSSLTATGGISAGASSSFTGGVSIVTGGLTVISGGADITGVSVIETYTARVYKGSAQAIGDSSVTNLTFDTERWDNGSLHSTSSNTDRLVAPVAGKYLITAHIQWASNATGERQLRITDSSGNVKAMHSQAPISGNVTRMSLATVVSLTATDYVVVQVFQSSGGSLDVTSASQNSPEATITKIA